MVSPLSTPLLRRVKNAALHPKLLWPAPEIPVPIMMLPHTAYITILLREDIAHREIIANQQLAVLHEYQRQRQIAIAQELLGSSSIGEAIETIDT